MKWRSLLILRSYKNPLLLLLTASIWGVAFVAQSVGMDYVGPFTFSAVRFVLGGTVLLPFLMWKYSATQKKIATISAPAADGAAQEKSALTSTSEAEDAAWADQKRTTLLGGICCGCALSMASLLQQIGITQTSVAKAGFITALYIVIVPLAGLLFHKKVRRIIWLGVLLAVAGMYLLCIKETFAVSRGDVLLFLGAVIFAVHILVIDYFSPKADGVALSCIQFYTCGIICGIGMLLFETPTWQALVSGWLPILYAGILSSGVGYTLQIVGQKGMDPTVASLILSLESVISLIAGWIILGQALTPKEICGCMLVFAAIVLVQLPEKGHKNT